MQPYKELIHGGDVVSARLKNPGAGILDFSANINPLGIPESVKRAVIGGIDQNARYPDPLCRELRQALSRYEGVPDEWILCGAGAADLIFRLACALRPKRALLLAPTFAEYELALLRTGCECVFHTLRESDGFAPRSQLEEEAEGCELVFICNPNNPTGVLIEDSLLRRVLDICIHTGAVLAVDECFLDFLPDGDRHSLKDQLGRYGRLVILRAFTKIFALPGLRLGYALCSGAELLRGMDESGPPWGVSVPAQLAGIAAAGEREYLIQTRSFIKSRRIELENELAALGLVIFPGSGNYIFFRSWIKDLADRCADRGVLIRNCAGYRGLEPGYYRVAVRSEDENAALIEALRESVR